jgi:hypothetical protein
MMVMITAMTPSLNASTRAVPISSDRPERSWSSIVPSIIGKECAPWDVVGDRRQAVWEAPYRPGHWSKGEWTSDLL